MKSSILRVRGATDRDVLAEMAKHALDLGFVTGSYREALLERERSFPTGLFFPDRGFGLALPHADPELVRESALILGFPEEPVPFRRMGDPDSTVEVEVVVLLVLEDTGDYNRILSCLVELFQEASFVRGVREQPPDALLDRIVSRCFEPGG